MSDSQPGKSFYSKKSGSPAKASPPRENTFLNLGFNLVIPFLILSKGKKWLEPYLESFFETPSLGVLLLAIAFPIVYFFYDYLTRKKYNLFSIIGLVSVLLTGGIGILEIPTEWFAVKEAAIPLLLGLALVISMKTPYPLVRTLLYNPEIINVQKVESRLEENQARYPFEKLLVQCTWLLAASFLLSAVLNYFLARWMVTSPAGTDAFNQEVAGMMWWSFVIITVPGLSIMLVAMIRLFKGIKRMTGLELEEILHGAKTETGSE